MINNQSRFIQKEAKDIILDKKITYPRKHSYGKFDLLINVGINDEDWRFFGSFDDFEYAKSILYTIHNTQYRIVANKFGYIVVESQ